MNSTKQLLAQLFELTFKRSQEWAVVRPFVRAIVFVVCHRGMEAVEHHLDPQYLSHWLGNFVHLCGTCKDIVIYIEKRRVPFRRGDTVEILVELLGEGRSEG